MLVRNPACCIAPGPFWGLPAALASSLSCLLDPFTLQNSWGASRVGAAITSCLKMGISHVGSMILPRACQMLHRDATQVSHVQAHSSSQQVEPACFLGSSWGETSSQEACMFPMLGCANDGIQNHGHMCHGQGKTKDKGQGQKTFISPLPGGLPATVDETN